MTYEGWYGTLGGLREQRVGEGLGDSDQRLAPRLTGTLRPTRERRPILVDARQPGDLRLPPKTDDEWGSLISR